MSKSKKVWVADDDESIRFVLEKGLVDAGLMYLYLKMAMKL